MSFVIKRWATMAHISKNGGQSKKMGVIGSWTPRISSGLPLWPSNICLLKPVKRFLFKNLRWRVRSYKRKDLRLNRKRAMAEWSVCIYRPLVLNKNCWPLSRLLPHSWAQLPALSATQRLTKCISETLPAAAKVCQIKALSFWNKPRLSW